MSNQAIPFEKSIRHASLSDIGMRRQNNQDAMNSVVTTDPGHWQNAGHLFIVADGMGAHAAGELASKLAADGIALSYSKATGISPPDALQRAILDANTKIHEKGKTDVGFQGMGTTCSSVLLLPQGAVVGHVGDSRAYRLRGHRLDQLTFDHSLVWEMRAAGKLTGKASEINLPKNIITRSLGPNAKVQVDLEGPFPIAVGDTFLLCSDGLTGPVKDEEIGVIISCLPPEEAVQGLVDLANLRGGPDNITVSVIRVEAPPVGESDTPEEQERKGAHPAIWAVSGICLIAAVIMFLMSAKLPAALCVIGAIVAALVGILQRFDKEGPVTDGPVPIPILGRGPYQSFDCPPSEAITNELSDVANQLRDTVKQLGRDVDLTDFERLTSEAASAAQQGDHAEATRGYVRGISGVVAQLKKHDQNRRISDSHVDLF